MVSAWQGNKTDVVICSYDDHFLVSFSFFFFFGGIGGGGCMERLQSFCVNF